MRRQGGEKDKGCERVLFGHKGAGGLNVAKGEGGVVRGGGEGGEGLGVDSNLCPPLARICSCHEE